MVAPVFTLEELISIHELRPNDRVIYVEGEDDRRILKWFVNRAGYTAVVVNTIECVDIAEDMLLACGETRGRRGEVVCLAVKMAALLTRACSHTFCIIDRDLSDYFGPPQTSTYLLTTDYTDMEMYSLEPPTIDKFAHRVFGSSFDSELLASIETISRQLFLIRLARRAMSLRFRMARKEKYLCVRGNRLEFELESFIANSMTTSGEGERIKELKDHMSAFGAKVSANLRLSASGKDFQEVLAFYLQHRKKDIRHSLNEALWLTVEFDDLQQHGLFEALSRRLADGTPQRDVAS